MNDESRPIGKGARFRVMTGVHIGAIWTVERVMPDGDLYTPIGCGGCEFTVAELEGPGFQRLADAPAVATVDPIFDELEALEAERAKTWGGPAEDDKKCASEWGRFAKEDLDAADSLVGDDDSDDADAAYRRVMMSAALMCLAAVRCIDRAHAAR